MIEIDGGYGEGGGQLVRTAVALAAVRQAPVRVVNVRARRRNAGLAPQHVAAIQAVAAMCDARCEGVAPRSTAFSLHPQCLHGGRFRVDVGTAGSIPLVLQAMLPVAVACGEPCAISLRGGTDVPAAPPMDYFRWVLLPLLEKVGLRVRLAVERRGYYPKGGGEVQLELMPAPLAPLVAEAAAPVERIDIHAHVAQLPSGIAERMVAAARLALPPSVPVTVHLDAVSPDRSGGPGGAIVLCAPTAATVLGAAQVAQRGVRAETLGHLAAESLAQDLRRGATVDVHAADQLLVFLALARGSSRFRARELTSHARTTMWLLERFAAARFDVTADAGTLLLRVKS